MKKIDIQLFENSINLITWFITVNFPEGYDEEEDISCIEYMEENFELDDSEINELTQYYDGVFDDNDGYVDHPNYIEIQLSDKTLYRVAFHPGDVEYYVGDDKIGCTGPHYETHSIAYSDYLALSKGLSELEKLFLLPMLSVSDEDTDEFQKEIQHIFSSIRFQDPDNMVCRFILSNCIE